MQNSENNETIPQNNDQDTSDAALEQANEDDQSQGDTETCTEPDDVATEDGLPTYDEAEQDQGDEPVEDQVDQEAVPDDQADTEPEDSNSEKPDESPEISTMSVVEAVLFAADEPVTAGKLSEIVGAGGVRETKKHIQSLNDKYEQMDCAFRIEIIAGGYQLLTQSKYNPWLSKLIKVRSESKLTPAAMETLAIIAYKQPILRVDIENVRGVAAGEMIRQLIEKGVVKIVGRAEELGRPLLYGTTKKFLEVFGLGSLKDLPTLEEAKKKD